MRPVTDIIAAAPYAEAVFHLVELFYSEHCLGCPDARANVQRLAAERPDVVVIERNIDEQDQYDLAIEYQLIATPALVIDGQDVLYGAPRLETLTARIGSSPQPPA